MNATSPTGTPGLICGIGSHDGGDLPCCLEGADVVASFEANPKAAALIAERHATQVAAGRLRIIHAALTTEPCDSAIAFHVHRTKTHRSPTDRPRRQRHMCDRVLVPTMNVDRLFQDHGPPASFKIDVEHHDDMILREMF